MLMLRLDKLIAESGMYSRSEAAALIRSGRVSVSGIVASQNSEKINPETQEVSIDGRLLEYKRFHYIMLNKPQGYVSSTQDRRERTVMELLDERFIKLGLFPAGRLDKDAEGFLLLTNDGEFAHKVTSPTGKVTKRYFALLDGEVTDDDIGAFSRGITLGDGTICLPAVLERASEGAFITLSEGKYHQVKRMMASIGKPVRYLKRTAIGGLMLDEGLELGEYRELSDEIRLIFGDSKIHHQNP